MPRLTSLVALLVALALAAPPALADNPPKRTDIDPTIPGNNYGHCQKNFNPKNDKPFCVPPP